MEKLRNAIYPNEDNNFVIKLPYLWDVFEHFLYAQHIYEVKKLIFICNYQYDGNVVDFMKKIDLWRRKR